MSNTKIDHEKLYETVLESRRHLSLERDEINKYYTSLFIGILGVMPFIDQFVGKNSSGIKDSFLVQMLSLSLSIIGLTLSINWILILKRIYDNIEGTDELIFKLENDLNISFFTFVKKYSNRKSNAGSVSKQVMTVPYVFAGMFLIVCFLSINFGKLIANI